MTLDDALRLLTLPRVLGTGADGEEITAQNGRYGPVHQAGQGVPLAGERGPAVHRHAGRGAGPAGPAQDPRPALGRRGAPLRELGDDPASGKPMVVREGRFGPYVTDGETNASLRKGDEVETITIERAAELLADRRERAPVKKAAKKAPAKKAAAKKTAAKKAPREEGHRGQEGRRPRRRPRRSADEGRQARDPRTRPRSAERLSSSRRLPHGSST